MCSVFWRFSFCSQKQSKGTDWEVLWIENRSSVTKAIRRFLSSLVWLIMFHTLKRKAEEFSSWPLLLLWCALFRKEFLVYTESLCKLRQTVQQYKRPGRSGQHEWCCRRPLVALTVFTQDNIQNLAAHYLFMLGEKNLALCVCVSLCYHAGFMHI